MIQEVEVSVFSQGAKGLMESRPWSRLRRSPPPDGSDLISVLPDEMLRLIIARIGCVRATVRSGLLSRRWRGLWIGVGHTNLMLRDFTPAMTEALLARFAASSALSTIDIRLSNSITSSDPVRQVNSLLRTAALLSPTELAFTLTENFVNYAVSPLDIELPCFNRATSIELDTGSRRMRPAAPAGEFTQLQSLSLRGKFVDLGAMLDRCPRLRTINLAFRSVAPDSVEATLASLDAAAPGASVCLLDICIHQGHHIDAARFASLLRTLTRVSPQELVLTRPAPDFTHRRIHHDMTMIDAQLPCFNRATSINMSLHKICFTQLPAGEFMALEMLSLSGNIITDLATLLNRCPRLRELTLVCSESTSNIRIHSMTLQKLNVYRVRECQSIDIVTPVLQQLMLEVHADTKLSIDIVTPVLQQLMLEVHADTKLSVSISAPMVQNVMWERSYIGLPSVFGFWSIPYMSLKTVHQQSRDPLGAELDFAIEMEKILVTEFSMLELHLGATNHISGGLVSRLLGMHRIQAATQRFKVILEHPSKNAEVVHVTNPRTGAANVYSCLVSKK
ncbi:uncharacterized protein [Lolium perenne]|uniref:uncharacterized protein n=1 Tax=Lolium perenne TaxID=4522 RepID=UPI0021F546FA|nr:uncharacterized protein LOC127339069 [Lolium perenne]